MDKKFDEAWAILINNIKDQEPSPAGKAVIEAGAFVLHRMLHDLHLLADAAQHQANLIEEFVCRGRQ